jgi:antitoxin component YwqK of YwqJK toxin-antitoxin module
MRQRESFSPKLILGLLGLLFFLQLGRSALAQGSGPTCSPEDLEERGGLFYRSGDNSPYSGQVRDLHESGTPRLEAFYRVGRLESSKVWYENGKLAEEVSVSGDNWLIRRFSEDGRLEEETTAKFKNGRKVSEQSKRWHENGQLKSEAGFENGKLQGPLKEYSPDGTLLRDEVYDQGQLTKKAK